MSHLRKKEAEDLDHFHDEILSNLKCTPVYLELLLLIYIGII